MKTTQSCYRFPTSKFLILSAALLAVGLTPVFAGPTNNSNPEQNAARMSSSTTSTMSTTDTSALSKSDQRFLAKTAKETDQEIALAQLASERASNPEVRNYARMLITDQQLVQMDVNQIASQKNVMLRDDATASSASTSSSAGKGSLASYQDRNAPLASGDGSMGPNTGTGSQIASADHTALDQELAVRGNKAFTSRSTTEPVTVPSGEPGTAVVSMDRDYQKLSKESGSDFDREYLKVAVDDHESDVKEFTKQAQNADSAEVRAFASKQVSVTQQHLNRAKTLAAAVR